MRADLGPIWRSTRRSRAFLLLVVEVAIGFLIVGSLVMTSRFYGQASLPPSGHRESDMVEVVSRAPAVSRGAGLASADLVRWGEERRRRDAAALAAMPDVERVVAVSATQVDGRFSVPSVFWSQEPAPLGSGACPGVHRSGDGRVVGWTVETEPDLAEVIGLTFVEGGSLARLDPAERSHSVIITRCLRDTLFGGRAALGRTLHSNRFPPARITGVVEDVRMRVPYLQNTAVTAIFAAPPPDERHARYLVRTAPSRAEAVAAAVPAVLGAGLSDPDRIVSAGAFSVARVATARSSMGTVILLLTVTGALGVVAILGNLAIAAFLVGERRRVIGLRRALGATRTDILRYLLLEAMIPTQIGNALGFAVVLAMLPGVQRRFPGLRLEPLDMLATALLLSLAGIAARLLPALRATRIPPSEVTRGL